MKSFRPRTLHAVEPLSDGAPPYQVAARSFHQTVTEILKAQGRSTTQREICAIMNLRTNTYSDALNGRRGSLDAVATWCDRWAAAGQPELVLITAGRQQTVVLPATHPFVQRLEAIRRQSELEDD